MADVLIRVIGNTGSANRALGQTERRVKNLRRATRQTQPAVRGLRTNLSGLSQTAGLAQSSIFQMTGSFIAVGGLLLAIRATSRASIEFQFEMTKLNTLVGIAPDKVDEWSKSLRNMAPAIGIGPRELSKALFVVTSAGIRTAEALKIVELAGKASAIGLGDTASIARAVTSAMQAYQKTNLTAAAATDVLVATVREGNLVASELASSLGRVLGIAAEVGVGFAELGGFIATFTRVGVTAEEAVTALRGILNTTLKPTKQATDALAQFGITVNDIRDAIRGQGLARTLIDLVQVLREDENALAAVIGNVRALSGVLATAGAQAVEFDRIVQSVADSTGILEEGFVTVGTTAKQSMAEAKAAVEVLALAIGDKLLPVIAKMASGWAGLLVPVNALAEETKKLLSASSDQNALALQLNAIGVARIKNEERIAAMELSRARGGSLKGLQERIELLKSQNIAFAFGVQLLQEMAKAQAAAFEIAPTRTNVFVRPPPDASNLQAEVSRQLSVTLGDVAIKPRAIDTSKVSEALSATVGQMLGDAAAIVDAAATPSQRLAKATDALNLSYALGKTSTQELAQAQAFLNDQYKKSSRSFVEIATVIGPAIASLLAQVIQTIRGQGGGLFGALSGILGGAAAVAALAFPASPLIAAGLTAGSLLSSAFRSQSQHVTVDRFGSEAVEQQRQIESGPRTVIIQVLSATGEIIEEVIYEIGRRSRTDNIRRFPVIASGFGGGV